MPQIGDILRFKKELFFEGAVQADWFYDVSKREIAAKSFVFHGPEYFGVTEEDVQLSSHNLMDTCSFTDLIASKLYDGQDGNSIVMAIAGYGTGKSHLAVTLGTLFSHTSKSSIGQKIIKNITDADNKIGTRIKDKADKPNFVITLNGMKDFNLNYEILNLIKKTLKEYSISDDIIKDVTKPYEIAKYFIHTNFENMKDSFEKMSKTCDINYEGVELKNYLERNIESDPIIFAVVNDVYKAVTGGSIRWDDSLDIGRVLEKLQENLCGDRNPFNKILILFDEFGRFIEYTASYPARAGDSALQQVFEAIQNADNNIVFAGFIQSDLKTYMARVERSSNIARYVGRFEFSEKIYLSSNLETIFANLIERKDSQTFKKYISSRLDSQRYNDVYVTLHQDMQEWIPTIQYRGVWKKWDNFSKIILEGIYPLHPITTWILSNISNWLQQRSALVFVNSIIERYSDQPIEEFGTMPTVKAVSIIQSDFFLELLRAEEEGRQQSEYCILYNQLLRKYKDKLNQEMLDILAANVVLRIGRFRTKNRYEVIRALSYCIDYSEELIVNGLHQLEEEYGVLNFDENAGCFDFIADAIGAQDFRRFINKKRMTTKIDLSLAFQSDVQNILPMDIIDTPFSNERNIRTSEWQYEQNIRILDELSLDTLRLIRQEWENATSPEKAKGKVTWVYVPVDTTQSKILELQGMMNKINIDETPLLFMLLDDKDNRLYEAVNDYYIALNLSQDDKIRFVKFYTEFEQKSRRSIEDRFTDLAKERLVITGKSIEQDRKRLRTICNQKFIDIYPKIVSFPFEGFHNRRTSTAKKIMANIARNLLFGTLDYQHIQAQSTDFKNRVDSMFVIGQSGSWGILDDHCELLYPENESVRSIFEEIDQMIETSDNLVVKDIFDKYFMPPYGMNEFCLGLLLACYISDKKVRLKIKYEGRIIKTVDWANLVYTDKGITFKVLEQSELFFIDEDEYADRFIDICSKIEKTDDIIEALKLQKELMKLKEEEQVPEILADKVRGCEFILEECERLSILVNADLDKNHNLLHKAQIDNVSHAIKVLKDTDKRVGFVEDSKRFKYTGQIYDEFVGLNYKARNLIEDGFEKWLDTVKCDSPNQVSGFENWMKNMIFTLADVGYSKFARLCQNKLDNILSDLSRIRLLHSLKERVDSFIKTCRPTEQTTYNTLSEWSKTGKDLINELNNHPVLKRGEIADYIKDVNRKLEEIDTVFDDLKQDINDVYNNIFDLTTIADCNLLLHDIKKIVQRQINDVDREGIEEIGDYLQNFIYEIERIEFDKMNRRELSDEAKRLETKWIDEEAPAVLDDVLETLISEKEDLFNLRDEQWNKKYLSIDLKEVFEWSAEKCIRWLKDVELIPRYLSDSSLKQREILRGAVEKRLEQNSIDAVIKMFLKLPKDQQIMCFNNLKEHLELNLIKTDC